MKDDSPNTLSFAAAGLVAVSCAIVVGFGFSALATPPDFTDRLSATTQAVARLEASAKAPRRPAEYRPDATCASGDAAEIAAVQQRLNEAAAAAGLTVTRLSMTPVDASPGRLSPYQLQMEATGPYDGAVGFLGGLSASAPTPFVDRLDLRRGTAGVQLSLSSKVFCWTGADS